MKLHDHYWVLTIVDHLLGSKRIFRRNLHTSDHKQAMGFTRRIMREKKWFKEFARYEPSLSREMELED